MENSRQEREKLVRESGIISAAERLFFQKGYENTSVDEIAAASEFTKRTVYKYFVNKEDLFYAVILKGIQLLLSYLNDGLETCATGYEKFQKTKASFYRFSKENSELFRLMNYSQFIPVNGESGPHFREVARLNSRFFTDFCSMAELGVKDGSIRADFEIPNGVFSLFFLLTGFMSRISALETLYSSRFGIDADALVRLTFEYIDRLMAPNGQPIPADPA